MFKLHSYFFFFTFNKLYLKKILWNVQQTMERNREVTQKVPSYFPKEKNPIVDFTQGK